jgi:hypothetical protein
MFKILNVNGEIYLMDTKNSKDNLLITEIGKIYILNKGDIIQNERWEFKIFECFS